MGCKWGKGVVQMGVVQMGVVQMGVCKWGKGVVQKGSNSNAWGAERGHGQKPTHSRSSSDSSSRT